MADGAGHHLHSEKEHNYQTPAQVENSIAVLSAEIEQLKIEYEHFRNLIEALCRDNGYQIPEEYKEAWSRIRSQRDCSRTSVGLFSGSPVVAHQPIARSSKPKKKNITSSVPRAKGNTASAVQCVNPATHKDNQQEMNRHALSAAEAVPVFRVSQNGINDQMEFVKFTNVFPPVSSTFMANASVNRPYLMTQGLQNSQQLYLPQQTNDLVYSGNVSNKATKHREIAACGQVLNHNSQSHPCQRYTQASGQYTSYKAAHNILASNNRVSQQLNRQPSVHMVSTDAQSGDTIPPNNGFVVGLSRFYTNPQHNYQHLCKQARIICMPMATAPTKADSNTYLPTNGYILSTPQPQQQCPKMTSMHREDYGLVTPNNRVFTSNEALFTKSHQNVQDVSQISNAPTSRQTFSTTAAPCCGESTSRQVVSTTAAPCCGETTSRQVVSTTATPCCRESAGLFVSHISSQRPVLQHSTQNAQLPSLPVLEPGIATSSQHYAQKAQLSDPPVLKSGIETSSQHSTQEPQLSSLSVLKSGIETSSQHSTQEPQLSSLSVHESGIATSSQHSTQERRLPSLSVHESGIVTPSQAVHNQLTQTPLHQIYRSPPGEYQPTVQPTFLSTPPQSMQSVVSGLSTPSPSHHMTLTSPHIGGSAGSYGCSDYISEIPALSFHDFLSDDYSQ